MQPFRRLCSVTNIITQLLRDTVDKVPTVAVLDASTNIFFAKATKDLAQQWRERKNEGAEAHVLDVLHKKTFVATGVHRRWLDGIVKDETGNIVVSREDAQRFRSSLSDLTARLQELEVERRRRREEEARQDAERLAQQA